MGLHNKSLTRMYLSSEGKWTVGRGSSDSVTLQYQTEGYHVVLVFNSAKVLEMFIMTLLLLVITIMILCLLKWTISLTCCCFRNWIRKKEVSRSPHLFEDPLEEDDYVDLPP